MIPLNRFILLAMTGLFLASPMAKAAPTASNGASGPVDISADESLEYHKDKNLYIARGNAKAIRGDMIVDADILTAKQRDKTQKSQNEASGDIAFLTAEGHVKITDPKQQIYGDKAVYDMDSKNLRITGTDLKYITDKDVVTAKDSLEYFDDKGVAVARGNAIATHEGNRIEADILTAHFKMAADGQRELSHMTAKGHVIVVTKDGGISRGNRGLYDAKKDTAYLMDNVRITRGETQLAGEKAEVNFTTGQSRLLSDGTGRVRALLPSSNKKEEK